jgi:3-hydroxyacyl-[acyl-carrier-protein] dehydratase
MTPEEIFSLLPYSKPFLFVDKINYVNENSAQGLYTFDKEEFFYKGHFKDFPVTPGVILIETMAQIGVVSLGIFLLNNNSSSKKLPDIALVSAQADFLLPVFPGETVVVTSEKIYFRFGKLKCNVEMKNQKGELICKAVIAGMVRKN